MFKELALLSQRLQHPNIVEVRAAFEDKIAIRCGMMVMPEYAWTLKSFIESPKSSVHALHDAFRQVAMALAFVHENRVVHCDVSPDNIFLESVSPMHARLGDFDVVR